MTYIFGPPPSGARGRDFFLQSGLSPSILGQIWQVADVDGDGCLNAVEFSVAMHLVYLALEGIQPPLTLPPPLAECVEVVTRARLPPVEDKHVLKCQTAFIAFKADIAHGTLGSKRRREGRKSKRGMTNVCLFILQLRLLSISSQRQICHKDNSSKYGSHATT